MLLLISTCWYSNARDLLGLTGQSKIVSALELSEKLPEREILHVEEINKNDQLCGLCEEFAAEAINYLSENKTQTEIISILHKSCSKIPSFKQQCIVLVDYYAPLFFLEASTIQAEEFCRKVALCQDVTALRRHSEIECNLCHDVLTEALLKLKDPNTELEVVQVLLKACNSIGKSAKKCKKLVFEYAPLILVNAEQFLEANDLCTILHACAPAAQAGAQQLGETATSMQYSYTG